MQRPRKLLACSLVLIGLGLRFATDVRAQPAPESKPAAPVPAQPVADAGAPPAPPSNDAAAPPPSGVAPGDAPPPADAGAPETSPAAPESPPVPAAPAEGSGSGLFESSQSGAGDEPAAGETGAPGGFDLGGYVRGDAFVGKETQGNRAEAKAVYGELSLKVNTPREKYGDAFAEARLRYGLQDVEQKVFIDVREAYVNAYFGPLDLRLGQQIIVWGRAD
ncbi:MAG TPA: DUF1302 family protein, partial [Polyangiaceae bacterium]|nr:DUF1302 family protein [Polyangiaceae bacterium]